MKCPRVTLSDADREVLRHALELGMGSDIDIIDSEPWLRHAASVAKHLPDILFSTLRDFKRDSGEFGAVVVDGLSVETLGCVPTPNVYNSVRRRVTPEVLGFMASLSVLGDAVAYEGEKQGALVHDIVPVPGYEITQSNAGSAALALHVENAFHEHRPDYILLLCVRQGLDGTAKHRLAPARLAIRRLAPDTIRVLFDDRFRTMPPSSFDDSRRSPSHPVFCGSFDDPDVCVDFAYTTGLDKVAKLALQELGAALDEVSEVISLGPGQLVAIDNRVTLHGRTPFTPLYDGQDRWLLRAFGKSDIRASRAVRRGDGRRVG